MMAPAGILQNTATGRFHPIVFRPAPMPSGADAAMGAQRYRSRGHHTEGFPTLDDARRHIAEQPDWFDAGVVWEWDGQDVPAMTEWFSVPPFHRRLDTLPVRRPT